MYYNYDEATVGLYFSYFEEISVESPFNQDREWTAVPLNLRSTATGLSHKAYKVILSLTGSWIDLSRGDPSGPLLGHQETLW